MDEASEASDSSGGAKRMMCGDPDTFSSVSEWLDAPIGFVGEKRREEKMKEL
jgi:hypothetical protein